MKSNPWLDRKMEIPPEIIALVDAARVNGCWIYHENTKEFYTPEEFEADWRVFVHASKRGNNFKDYKIVNPMYAIRLCSRWVEIANKKLQEVIIKSANYDANFTKK